MPLKKIIIFFTVLLITDVYSQQYWIRQTTPTTKMLSKSCFVDSLYGWVIGDSGTVIRTTNSGENWSLQSSGITAYALEDVYFLNRNYGWITCNDFLFQGTIILSTTNGGANWQFSRFPDTTLFFNTIYFLDTQSGFIGGYSGKIFKTTNAGTNWIETAYDTSGCFYLLRQYDFVFSDSQNGFACGGIFDLQGIIWKTTNGGMLWNAVCVSPEPLQEIKYLGGDDYAAMGGDFEFGGMQVQSSNLGFTWNYESIACFGNITGFDFRTRAEIWAALSFSSYLALNRDSMIIGTRWECIPAPDNEGINDVEFTTSTKGWCVGTNGSVFKFNTSVIGVNGNHNNLPAVYSLSQNYPNPFNPETIIRYSVPKAENVKITIYDMLGREIDVFDEGFRTAGEYMIKFNASHLPSGVYYYHLATNEFSISKKMVLIK